jgi:hypothetical protein
MIEFFKSKAIVDCSQHVENNKREFKNISFFVRLPDAYYEKAEQTPPLFSNSLSK